jgi:nucleoid DNA-binding protein
MTNDDLVALISEHLQWPLTDVSEVLDCTVSIIGEKLAEGASIFIDAFGKFSISKKNEYIFVHSKTGERYLMPPEIDPVFDSIIGDYESSEGLNIRDLAALIVLQNKTSNEGASNFLNELFSIIRSTQRVEIDRWGTFMLQNENRSDSTEALVFIPDKSLKDLVNKPFANFEPTLLNEGVEPDLMTISDSEEKKDEIILPESVETVLENQVIETAEKEKGSPIFEQEQSDNEIAECTPTEKSVSESLHSKKFVKKKNLFVPIMGVVAVAAAILFFFVPIGKREKQEVKIEKQIPSNEITKPATPLAEIKPLDAIENQSAEKPVKVMLSAGKTLRQLALEHFGSKEFWVYIYLENRDRISNPNIVHADIQLTLPLASKYDLNASDPSAIAKAKKLGEEVIRKF